MTARHVHVIETNGANPARARAEMLRKLRLIGELERKSADEVDRLSALAHQQGWTIKEIAEALKVKTSTLYVRRKHGWQRRKPGRRRPPAPGTRLCDFTGQDPNDDPSPEVSRPGEWEES